MWSSKLGNAHFGNFIVNLQEGRKKCIHHLPHWLNKNNSGGICLSFTKKYILVYSPGLKYSIAFIPLRICHTSTSQQYAGCLSHEPSLMALAPTSLLQLSGGASELVIGRSQVRLLIGALGISFFRVCLCHSLKNTFSTTMLFPTKKQN